MRYGDVRTGTYNREITGSFTPVMPVDNTPNSQLVPSPWISTANSITPCFGDIVLFSKPGLATTTYYIHAVFTV
jgi:hypothetical protein